MDKETGELKSSWEASVNLRKGQSLQMRVTSVDAVLGEVRVFDYGVVTLPTL